MTAGNEIKKGWTVETCPNCGVGWGFPRKQEASVIEDGRCPSCWIQSDDLLALRMEQLACLSKDHGEMVDLFHAAGRLRAEPRRQWTPPWYGAGVAPHDNEGPLFLAATTGIFRTVRYTKGPWVDMTGHSLLVDAWTPLPEYPTPSDLMPPGDTKSNVDTLASQVEAAVADHIRAGGMDQMMQPRRGVQR